MEEKILFDIQRFADTELNAGESKIIGGITYTATNGTVTIGDTIIGDAEISGTVTNHTFNLNKATISVNGTKFSSKTEGTVKINDNAITLSGNISASKNLSDKTVTTSGSDTVNLLLATGDNLTIDGSTYTAEDAAVISVTDKKVTSDSGTLTVKPSGSVTINGATYSTTDSNAEIKLDEGDATLNGKFTLTSTNFVKINKINVKGDSVTFDSTDKNFTGDFQIKSSYGKNFKVNGVALTVDGETATADVTNSLTKLTGSYTVGDGTTSLTGKNFEVSGGEISFQTLEKDSVKINNATFSGSTDFKLTAYFADNEVVKVDGTGIDITGKGKFILVNNTVAAKINGVDFMGTETYGQVDYLADGVKLNGAFTIGDGTQSLGNLTISNDSAIKGSTFKLGTNDSVTIGNVTYSGDGEISVDKDNETKIKLSGNISNITGTTLSGKTFEVADNADVTFNVTKGDSVTIGERVYTADNDTGATVNVKDENGKENFYVTGNATASGNTSQTLSISKNNAVTIAGVTVSAEKNEDATVAVDDVQKTVKVTSGDVKLDFTTEDVTNYKVSITQGNSAQIEGITFKQETQSSGSNDIVFVSADEIKLNTSMTVGDGTQSLDGKKFNTSSAAKVTFNLHSLGSSPDAEGESADVLSGTTTINGVNYSGNGTVTVNGDTVLLSGGDITVTGVSSATQAISKFELTGAKTFTIDNAAFKVGNNGMPYTLTMNNGTISSVSGINSGSTITEFGIGTFQAASAGTYVIKGITFKTKSDNVEFSNMTGTNATVNDITYTGSKEVTVPSTGGIKVDNITYTGTGNVDDTTIDNGKTNSGVNGNFDLSKGSVKIGGITYSGTGTGAIDNTGVKVNSISFDTDTGAHEVTFTSATNFTAAGVKFTVSNGTINGITYNGESEEISASSTSSLKIGDITYKGSGTLNINGNTITVSEGVTGEFDLSKGLQVGNITYRGSGTATITNSGVKIGNATYSLTSGTGTVNSNGTVSNGVTVKIAAGATVKINSVDYTNGTGAELSVTSTDTGVTINNVTYKGTGGVTVTTNDVTVGTGVTGTFTLAENVKAGGITFSGDSLSGTGEISSSGVKVSNVTYTGSGTVTISGDTITAGSGVTGTFDLSKGNVTIGGITYSGTGTGKITSDGVKANDIKFETQDSGTHEVTFTDSNNFTAQGVTFTITGGKTVNNVSYTGGTDTAVASDTNSLTIGKVTYTGKGQVISSGDDITISGVTGTFDLSDNVKIGGITYSGSGTGSATSSGVTIGTSTVTYSGTGTVNSDGNITGNVNVKIPLGQSAKINGVTYKATDAEFTAEVVSGGTKFNGATYTGSSGTVKSDGDTTGVTVKLAANGSVKINGIIFTNGTGGELSLIPVSGGATADNITYTGTGNVLVNNNGGTVSGSSVDVNTSSAEKNINGYTVNGNVTVTNGNITTLKQNAIIKNGSVYTYKNEESADATVTVEADKVTVSSGSIKQTAGKFTLESHTFDVDTTNGATWSTNEKLTAGGGSKSMGDKESYTTKEGKTYKALGSTSKLTAVGDESGAFVTLDGDFTLTETPDNGKFTYTDNKEYSTTDAVTYKLTGDGSTKIDSLTSDAQKTLYTATGTRDYDDNNKKVTYENDAYDIVGTYTLKVENGSESSKKLVATGTYTTDATKDNKTFHYNDNTYTATGETKLTITYDGNAKILETTDFTQLASASGQGTRILDSDYTFKTDYEFKYDGNTYTTANSGAILNAKINGIDPTNNLIETFKSGGATATIARNNTFRYKNKDYTADGADATLTLNYTDTTKSGTVTLNGTGTRVAQANTTFSWKIDGVSRDYTPTADSVVYRITTTDLEEKLYTAKGTRSAAEGETYSVTGGNTYTFNGDEAKKATYQIEIETGALKENSTKFISGTATKVVKATGDVDHTFKYEGTTYTAQNDSTLQLTIDSTNGDSETLISASAKSGNDYILKKSTSTVTIKKGVTYSPTNDTDLVKFTATDEADHELSNLSGGALKATMNNHKITLKGIEYSGGTTLTINSADSVTVPAGGGTFTAKGNFSTSKTININNKALTISGDDSVEVTFGEGGVTKISNVGDNATVTSAAGATTIETSAGNGTFTIGGKSVAIADNQSDKVTFTLNANGNITKIDGFNRDENGDYISVTIGGGNPLYIKRDGDVVTSDDGSVFKATDITIESYSVTYNENKFSVTATYDTNKTFNLIMYKDYSVDGTKLTLNEDHPVTVINNHETNTIQVGGVTGIGKGTIYLAGKDATSFKVGDATGAEFKVSGGTFKVDGAGIDVSGDNPIVTAPANAAVKLTGDGTFTVNNTELTMSDATSKTSTLTIDSNKAVTGITLNGTLALTTTPSSFTVNTTTVSVDGDTDGIIFKGNGSALTEIGNVNTDATITLSSTLSSVLKVDDTDSVAGVTTNKIIKYNTTKNAWVAGLSDAVANAVYRVSVNGDTISLEYSTNDGSTYTATKNVNDYKKAFGDSTDLVPKTNSTAADGGTLPTYPADGVTITNQVKELVITPSADKDYKVNGQTLGIPAATATTLKRVNDSSIEVTLLGNKKITYDTMELSGSSTATLASDTVTLATGAKVEKTKSNKTFKVTGNVDFDSIKVINAPANTQITSVDTATTNLTIGNKLLQVEGDNSYTVDLTANKISNIDGDVTISGDFAKEKTITTTSSGKFTINGNVFTVKDDSDGVTFKTDADGKITEISGLSGSVEGNFTTAIKVNNKDVQVTNDNSIGVKGDVLGVTELYDLKEGITVKELGGASKFITDGNGTYTFGEVGNQQVFVIDNDPSVTFKSSDNTKITGVEDMGGNSKLVVNSAVSSFNVNNDVITLTEGSTPVTLTLDDTGRVGRVKANTASTNITINSNVLNISDADVTVKTVGGFKVEGIDEGTTITKAKNATITTTDDNGTYTFPSHTFTIADNSNTDNKLTFVTGSTGDASVTSIDGLKAGTITFSAATENNLLVGKNQISFTDKANLQLKMDNDTVKGVENLTGSIDGLPEGATVKVQDKAVQINQVDLKISNVTAENFVTAYANQSGGKTGYYKVEGITNGASITEGKNASFVTKEVGTYTFNSKAYITVGDATVTVGTDNSGNVTSVGGLSSGTISGDFTNVIKVDGTDIKITGDNNVSVVADENSVVTAIRGIHTVESATTNIEKAANVSLVTANEGAFVIGGNSYTISGDTDVTLVTDANSKVASIGGLDKDKKLIVSNDQVITINGKATTLKGIAAANPVTLKMGDNNTISSVENLVAGYEIDGLPIDATVSVTGDNVTINGDELKIEYDSDGLVVYANRDTGYYKVTDVDAGVKITSAKNASLVVSGHGDGTVDKYIFNNGTYSIAGDSDVTLVTDDYSTISAIGGLYGSLTSPEQHNVVNNQEIYSTNTDITIVAASERDFGVASLYGNGRYDTVRVSSGVYVSLKGYQKDANSYNYTDTGKAATISAQINGTDYQLVGDADGIVIKDNVITGLDENAKLTINTVGSYVVNGSNLTLDELHKVIIGESGAKSARLYQEGEAVIADYTPADEIVDDILNTNISDTQINTINSETELEDGATIEATSDIKEVVDSSDKTLTINTNEKGGSAVVIGANASGDKTVNLHGNGNLVVVEATEKNRSVEITASGKGDSIVSSADVKVTLKDNGTDDAIVMPLAGTVTLDNYNSSGKTGIKVTNSDVAAAVRDNLIKTGSEIESANGAKVFDDKITLANGAKVDVNAATSDKTGIVNFYNVSGELQKVGYTTAAQNGKVDGSALTESIVLKGNYSDKVGTNNSLLGGSGDDTVFAGGGDVVDAGYGNNYIKLSDISPQGFSGATIGVTATEGTTTVEGFNVNDFADGEVVLIDTANADVSYSGSTVTFTKGNGSLVIEDAGAKESGNGIAFVNVRIKDPNSSNIVKTSIAKSNSAIKAASIKSDPIKNDSIKSDSEFATAYVGGKNSGVDFSALTQTANINLGYGTGTVTGTNANDTIEITFRDIVSLKGGSTNHTLIGSASTSNTLEAGNGAGSIYGGGSSNDLLIGNTTTDKTAASHFIFGGGDGQDTLKNIQFYDATKDSTVNQKADIVELSAGDTITGFTISDDNKGIVMAVNGTDSLTITDARGKSFYWNTTNADDDKKYLCKIDQDTIVYDGATNYYYVGGENATISVAAAAVEENSVFRLDSVTGGATIDGNIRYIDASAVKTHIKIYGSSSYGASLQAASVGSTLWGNTGNYDDTLIGGDGKDVFLYDGKNTNSGMGQGNDVIKKFDATNDDATNDVVSLYDISFADVKNKINSVNVAGQVLTLNMMNGNTLTIDVTTGTATDAKFQFSGSTDKKTFSDLEALWKNNS